MSRLPGHRQRRSGNGSRIPHEEKLLLTFLRRNIFGPLQIMSWATLWYNLARLELGSHQVEDEKSVIPEEDHEIPASIADLAEDPHGCRRRDFLQWRSSVEDVRGRKEEGLRIPTEKLELGWGVLNLQLRDVVDR